MRGLSPTLASFALLAVARAQMDIDSCFSALPTGATAIRTSGANGILRGTLGVNDTSLGLSGGTCTAAGQDLAFNGFSKQVIAIDLLDAPLGSSVQIRTCAATSMTTFDTMLYASYSCPTSVSAYGCIISNDDDRTCPGNSQSQLALNSITSTTVYVVLGTGANNGAGGAYQLSWNVTLPSPSVTSTVTLSRGASASGTATNTKTASITGSNTRSASAAATGTRTPSLTGSNTRSGTASVSLTKSPSVVATPSGTASAGSSPTGSITSTPSNTGSTGASPAGTQSRSSTDTPRGGGGGGRSPSESSSSSPSAGYTADVTPSRSPSAASTQSLTASPAASSGSGGGAATPSETNSPGNGRPSHSPSPTATISTSAVVEEAPGGTNTGGGSGGGGGLSSSAVGAVVGGSAAGLLAISALACLIFRSPPKPVGSQGGKMANDGSSRSVGSSSEAGDPEAGGGVGIGGLVRHASSRMSLLIDEEERKKAGVLHLRSTAGARPVVGTAPAVVFRQSNFVGTNPLRVPWQQQDQVDTSVIDAGDDGDGDGGGDGGGGGGD